MEVPTAGPLTPAASPNSSGHCDNSNISNTNQTSLEGCLPSINAELPVLGNLACMLDQLLDDQQQQQQQQQRLNRCEMERMSPDSSMDWTAKASSSSVSVEEFHVDTGLISPISACVEQQPDSTTSELSSSSVVPPPADTGYDSDAFNSDDSNESFVELQRNPNLLAEIAMQGQQQSNRQFDGLNVNGGSSKQDSESVSAKSKKRRAKKVKRAGDVILKCQECKYTTRFKEHLTSHMNRHSGERKHMCPDCGQTFKWSHSLKRHQRKHQQDGYRHRCRVCDKAFSRKDHLTIHEALHRAPVPGQEPFRCATCGAAFKSKKTLAGHAKTHNAERRAHRCPQCPSEFTRRASLNRHVRAAHAGETVCCPLCPAKFSYKSTLEDHKRAAHGGGLRQFECPLCGQDFAVKAYLSKHLVSEMRRLYLHSHSSNPITSVALFEE